MIDYYKSYYNFLDKHSVRNVSFTRNKKKHLGFERHHVVPKALGNDKKHGEMLLSEYDHCLAHILLNVALIQKGKDPLSYQMRDCISDGNFNLVTYWNPLSKIKVIGVIDGLDVEMTILDAAKFLINKQANYHFLKNRTKNGYVKALLMACIFPNSHKHNKIYGIRWRLAAF